MLFRNKSDDDRVIMQGGVATVVVPQGETHVVTAEEASGFVLQCGPDGAWEPADSEAKAAVEEAEKAQAADEDELSATEPVGQPPARPAESAPKADWVAYAEALGDTEAASKTKQQIIDEYKES